MDMESMKRFGFLGLATSITISFCLFTSTHAVAQEEELVLEEITVTARKRVENLQDLGLSVSALSKADLDIRFDVDLQSLANASPNLVIDDISRVRVVLRQYRSGVSAQPTLRKTSIRRSVWYLTGYSSGSTRG